LWQEPRSPIGREKRGREPPVIQILAYLVMVFPSTEGLKRKSPPLLSAMMGVRRKKKHGEVMFAG